MKIEQTSLVDYDEVNTQFRMKLPVLFQRLQRAALFHSESVGMGSQAMAKSGSVWILNRYWVYVLLLKGCIPVSRSSGLRTPAGMVQNPAVPRNSGLRSDFLQGH